MSTPPAESPFDARIEGVRIAWDEEERALKLTCIDPRGTLLVRECVFWNVGSTPIQVWLGDTGSFRFGEGAEC